MEKKVIRVGNLKLGGKNPIVIKGMIKSSLEDNKNFLKEVKLLKQEGCQILRVAIEKEGDLKVIDWLRNLIDVPLEADIHFNYRLALSALEKGVDCLRLNPLNIYRKPQLTKIAKLAKEKSTPVRVGVNSGGFKKKMGSRELAQAMVKKIFSYVEFLESLDFRKIMVSAKADSCLATILANQILYKKLPYPIHLGLTATGPLYEGLIKSSLTLGILIYQGIGSAIRVSLNSSSWEEVRTAGWILQSLGKGQFYPEIISCPTCSRCKVDLKKKVEKFKEMVYKNRDSLYNKNIKVALMGCAVNGPGEASTSDLGLAFAGRRALLFKRGKIIKAIEEKDSLDTLWYFLKRNYDG
ncbi:MAG: (E)-4-hydroxy-3-methylbut-2-enyl-diphosphate synthase [Candidatus Omnitrophica bacterium]|nr:(E)-4-hydroxy-3-methylbut-2-enyl-diphosphate synthase [Candidatus Omnitrophota bacterium]